MLIDFEVGLMLSFEQALLHFIVPVSEIFSKQVLFVGFGNAVAHFFNALENPWPWVASLEHSRLLRESGSLLL